VSDDRDGRSELAEGLHRMSRVAEGVATRLLGSRVTGRPQREDRPILGEEADAQLDRLGARVGRLLSAAGDGLKAHPVNPIEALEHTLSERDQDLEIPEGDGPITVGLQSLAGGVYKSAEALLDVVAPRKTPSSQADDGEADDGEADDGEVDGGDAG